MSFLHQIGLINYLQGIIISEIDISDHFLVDFVIHAETKCKETKVIKYRPTKSVDIEQFCTDVSEKLGALPNHNQVLRNLVDDYAPLRSLKLKVVAGAPWFDKEYADLRKLRRSAEQRFRRSGSDADKKIYSALRKQAIDTSFLKKKDYVREKLAKNPSKNLYSVVNQLIDREKEVILPNATSDKELANNFLIYFKEKIEKIRSSFTPVPASESAEVDPNIVKLTEFEPATLDEITGIVKSYGVKCSPEDPVPASLLSSSIETFAPFWLEIVNLCVLVAWIAW